MNHPWQQPIKPLEVYPQALELWRPVLFIRPHAHSGWEVMTHSGTVWTSANSIIRTVTQ